MTKESWTAEHASKQKEDEMKGMRKRHSVFVGLLLVILFSPLTTTSADVWKWPPTLTIGTTGVGSSGYAVLAGWTPVLEQMSGMKVRLRPDDNQSLIQRWLKSGEVDLLMNSVSEVTMGSVEATDNYASREGGPFPVRVVWLGQSTPYGFMVRGDSEIKTVYDLKPGHRIAYWTSAIGAVKPMDGLLAWAKLDKKDVTVVPFSSWASNIKSIAEGKADVALIAATAATAFEAEANPRGVRILDLPYDTDREGYNRYLIHRPTAVFGVCKDGIKAAIGKKTMITSNFVYATEKTDPMLIYNLTKWFHEKFDAYKDKHPFCKLMNIESFRETLDFAFLPIHEATIKYLKEAGQWTPKDDARQKYNADLLSKYEKAYKAAIAEADSKKISVEPRNKEWVDVWQNAKKDVAPVRVMFEIP
jgi:uncharacterized protein